MGVFCQISTHGWCFEATRNIAARLYSWREVEEGGGGRRGVSGVSKGGRQREREAEVGVGFSGPTFAPLFTLSFFSLFLFVYYNS